MMFRNIVIDNDVDISVIRVKSVSNTEHVHRFWFDHFEIIFNCLICNFYIE